MAEERVDFALFRVSLFLAQHPTITTYDCNGRLIDMSLPYAETVCDYAYT